MATISEALAIAVQHHQSGRLQAAEQIYRQILAADPNQADTLHLMGVIASQMGRHDMAIELMTRAIASKNTDAVMHTNLGAEFKALGKLDEAVAAYGRALELKPDHAAAHYNLGNAFQAQGKLDEAVASFRRATELTPEYVVAHNNLGSALLAIGKTGEAIACFCRALELRPNYAEAHYNLGTALQAQGKLDEAVDSYRRTLELEPGFQQAQGNLGNAFQAQGKLDEALACHRSALELRPELAEAHCNLGASFQALGKLDEAIACFRLATELKPDLIAANSNLLFAIQFSPTFDAAAIYDEHLRFNCQIVEPLAKFIEPHANNTSPSRRLRVGYVSPDFRDHCQSFFTLPLLRAHNHEDFEVFCYSSVATPDSVTDRLRAYANEWRTITGLSSEQIAERIRQDQIDILVDLTMHMDGGNILVFARKPAPVQVCWLAYPGTTGLTAIDYRLTDPHLDPPGLHDAYYSEKSIRLPDCFWCYDPLTEGPAVNSPPAVGNGYVTFGSLNTFSKIHAEVLKLWSRVLNAVEGSRLLLLAPEGSARRHVLDLLESEGIFAERITFVTRQPRDKYLGVYHQIDMGLDTFPYNGHTTSLDAFWMGVPVVTLVGKTVVGRAGLCQLHNLGLDELIANTQDQFVEISTRLAADLPRLYRLRATLRERIEKSPLMDAPRFARNVEAAYRGVWQRWCAESQTGKNRKENAPPA